MKLFNDPTRWLATAALVLFTPAFLLAHPNDAGKGHGNGGGDQGKKHRQVAEGGSAAGYLLTVGALSLGGMLVRSRLRARKVS